ncbi:MAG: hypothetical protein KAJ15_12550, partial [Spirochaetes bacterium]|nr:hypothetical protein [Spirochaetota bacterium]
FLDIPFNETPFLIFTPSLDATGNYYFGLFWELGNDLAIYTYPAEKTVLIHYINFFQIGYEFFRFYGPKKFNPGIIFDNEIILTIPYEYLNTMRFGLYLASKYIEPSIFFFQENHGLLSGSALRRETGFTAGIDIFIKWFEFSLSYRGTADILRSSPGWNSRIDFHINFAIKKSR